MAKKEEQNLDNKLSEISKEVIKIEGQSKKITVKTEKDVQKASEFLIQVQGRLKRVDELRNFFTEPYVEQRRTALEAKRKIDDLFNEQTNPLQKAKVFVKRLMSDYALEQERKARKEEERLLKLKEKREARAKEAGRSVTPVPAPMVERQENTVKTEAGKVVNKKTWKFEIEDNSKLPQNVIGEILFQAEQKGIYQTVIRKMVQSGIREIEGVRIYEDIDVTVSAR